MRRPILAVVGVLVGLLALSGHAASAPDGPAHLGAGQQLSASACGGGKLVITVTHKVVNDADSGFQGAWAFDAFNRQIQVWQAGESTCCATVNCEGQFSTIAGQTSPGLGSTNIFTSSVKGTFSGGYRTTVFTGTLNPSPVHPTRGNIGTFDYACDKLFNCNAFNWVSTSFTNTAGFDLAWWGWEYKYQNQRWINASAGSSGDISG